MSIFPCPHILIFKDWKYICRQLKKWHAVLWLALGPNAALMEATIFRQNLALLLLCLSTLALETSQALKQVFALRLFKSSGK